MGPRPRALSKLSLWEAIRWKASIATSDIAVHCIIATNSNCQLRLIVKGTLEEKVTVERHFSMRVRAKNTERSTQWRAFRLEKANESKYLNRHEKCPDDLLENPMISLLNKWLPAFVVKARREDANDTPLLLFTNFLLDFGKLCVYFVDRLRGWYGWFKV